MIFFLPTGHSQLVNHSMKIKRYKHARRHLSLYRNIFNFREPYLILVDGTFTRMALIHQTNIKDQLPKYLNGEIQVKIYWIPNQLRQARLYEIQIMNSYKLLKLEWPDISSWSQDFFRNPKVRVARYFLLGPS